MSNTTQIIFSLMFTVFVLVGCGTTKDERLLLPSLFTQLSQDKPLELTLEMEADWQHLIDNKLSEMVLPVTVSWQEAGNLQQVKAEVSTRGHARRNICTFPPLRLRFTEENLDALELNSDYKSLKLVTHCINVDEDLVLREYLAYKMLNILTDHSLRVQLAKINYKCSKSTIQSYAFLIENNEEMAERLGGVLMEADLNGQATLDATQYRLMAVFQYMIGNTDWSITKQHNIKLVHFVEQKMLLPVPYDFDYSGMVNAAYAIPSPKLPIKSVRERYFQWRGKDAAELQATLALFQEKKQALYDLVMGFELLAMESRLDIMNYLDAFYANMPQKSGMVSEVGQ
ncbi:MAG: hypothetical protein ACK4TA_12905 [Saprospiraceae bacterium]